MIIAIDGPSGAGKSTVAKAIATRLGFSCLDTGAMYRCIAWQALEDGVSLDDGAVLGQIAREREISFETQLGNPVASVIRMGGADVTKAIRVSRIDRSVGSVSAHPSVRDALLQQQRRIGYAGNYVVEGRDIGTVVFPDAEVKVFLTASPEERARRRVGQNKRRGVGNTSYQEVLADIISRDALDSSRDTAPLAAAEDAILIDSTVMKYGDVVDRICALARERMTD